MARSSGLNANAARMTLAELGDAVAFHLRLGSPVVVPGLGRLRLTMDRRGELQLKEVAEKALLGQVLNRGAFKGQVEGKERADWADVRYKGTWDAEFPKDPPVVPVARERPVRRTSAGPAGAGGVGRTTNAAW